MMKMMKSVNFWQLSIKFDQFLIQIKFGFGICVGNGIVAMILMESGDDFGLKSRLKGDLNPI